MRYAVLLERCLIALLLLGVGLFSFERARQLRYDFHHFYRDARFVWEHAALNPVLQADDKLSERQLPFYLPIVPLVLAPLTVGGVTPAAAIWALLQVGSLGYAIRELRRRWAPLTGAFGLALALAFPAIYEAAFFNQLSFPILALCLAAIRSVEANNRFASAIALASACVIKLLPGSLLAWLVLQRPRGWFGVVIMTVTVMTVLTLAPCYVAFGPADTHHYLIQWVNHNASSSRAFDLLDPQIDEHFLGHANQSIRAVVARWTWSEHPYRMPVQPLSLSRAASDRISSVITFGLGALWIALTVRTRSRQDDSVSRSAPDHALFSTAAIWMMAMLVFSPLMRQYYLVWAWPALAFLAQMALGAPTRASARFAWIGVAAWSAGMALWPVPFARLAGAHLLMLIVMAVCVSGASRAAMVRLNRSNAAPA